MFEAFVIEDTRDGRYRSGINFWVASPVRAMIYDSRFLAEKRMFEMFAGDPNYRVVCFEMVERK